VRTIIKLFYFFIVLSFLLVIPFSLFADTYYVDGASGDDGWGGSSESPFATIQQAVDSTSASGDEIRVAQGTYTGISPVDVDISGETDTFYQVVFIRNKSLTLQGGYDTSNWTTSDPITNITTIDAGESGRCITIRNSTSETVTIDGFTITGGDYSDLGNADEESNKECGRTSSDCGGGLYAYYVKLILKNSVVTGNKASDTSVYSDGGGIYLYNCISGTEIDNVTVSNNTTTTSDSNGGGLMVIDGSDITISRSTFSNNYCLGLGGGIGLDQPDGTVMIEETEFSGNTGFYNGGAIGANLTYSSETALYVNRANLDNNNAKTGACIYLRKWSSNKSNAYLNNLILSNNTSSASGNENSLIYIADGSDDIDVSVNHVTASNNSATSFLFADDPDSGETTSVTVNNTIIDVLTNAFVGSETTGGDVVISYNNILLNCVLNTEVTETGLPVFNAGETITGNPLLDATYHLKPGSPAINAGMDAGITTDIDGDARPKGSGYDIGADEFYARTLSGIIMMLLN